MQTVSDDRLRSALYELELVEQELSRRRKERGIDYFIPNAPQLAALRSKARVTAYCGGNRSGKSTTGAIFLTSHLTGQYGRCDDHGDWFGQRRPHRGPVKAVIVATEFPIIERVIEPKLMAYLPKSWIASLKRTPQGYLRRLVGRDGSTVDILSNEMDPMAFESADWDLAWIDEPLSKGRYVAIHRGLTDRRGLMMLTFTPLVEPWMKQELLDKADDQLITVIQADTYANLADIHGTPILTTEAIRDLEAVMDDEQRATRIHGQFFHLRGLVYKEFTPSVHLKAFEYQYPDPVLCAIDPHDRLPHHVVWAWLNRQDHLHVDRELVLNGTVQELKRAMLGVEAQAGYRMRARLIDPNFCQRPLITTGRTLLQELMTPPFAVQCTPANDDKAAGHLKVKEYLHFNRLKPVDFTNSPKLFFHTSRVPTTVRSLQNYQYEEWHGPTAEQRDAKEKERQKDTHGSDCIRYLCMSNPLFDRLTLKSQEYELEHAIY